MVKRRAAALASAGPSRGALDAMMRVAAVELKRGLYDDAVRHYETWFLGNQGGLDGDVGRFWEILEMLGDYFDADFWVSV